MKQHLEDFLVWALGKLNIQRLKQLTIDENRVSVGYSKFIPDDEEWHQISLSVSFWLKRNKKGDLSSYGDVKLYTDGEQKASWTLDKSELHG